MNKVSLCIDGHNIEALEGQNLLQAALDSGIYIPHLCYHPDLTPLGGCKLCSVEIKGKDGIVQSCETKVEEGMVVSTKTEAVTKLRNLALELMLASHPKDCTSCDKYLNCELQALMQYMGVAHSRLREIEKENIRIAQSDKLIKKEMQRCIQCSRCVRVCEEYRGVKALSFNKKNGETYINTVGDKLTIDSDCRFCGACVEVCPTGAIQDVKGIFSKDSPRNMAMIPCKNDCPAHTDIPEYIRLTNEGKYSEAVSVIREKLTFPHSLGYICTHACESGCKRTHLNEAISIREIKKFAVENDKKETWKSKVKYNTPNGKKIAVIGGGPSGMTAAYYLAKKGYEVDVYERQKLAGGMLSYGIPKYRLPQAIVNNELQILTVENLKLYVNSKISSLDDLKDKGYNATLIALGAGAGKRPPVYNNKWSNAIDAVDFCRMANEGIAVNLGDSVTVYGGGNVAFDCARTAKMMGVKNVRVVCLEARESMLADKEEVSAALEEGIEILNSKSMSGIESEHENVKALNLVDVRGFSFSSKGLELDVIENSESKQYTDTLIFATGQQPELSDNFGVELVKGTFAKTNDKMLTSKEGVFACGDVTYGTKSVVQAIASGRDAAMNIDMYLGGDGDISEQFYERPKKNSHIGTKENFAKLKRKDIFNNGFEATEECGRCLQCDLRLDIQKVRYWVDPHYKRVKEVAK